MYKRQVFTRTDLLDRVVLADLPLDTPVGQAMSPNPFMIEEHATAYDAMFAMATHGIRHVLVTDAEGKLTGVVSERDLFSLQRVGLRQIRQSIDGATDVEALQQAAAGRPDVTLVINADAGASHQSVVNVLEAARLAGLAKVTFAAQSPASGAR